MKISCQTCHAKYTVADEKIVGRIAKIKCKKCGSTIVVNGNDPSLLAQASPPAGAPPASPAHAADDEGETRIFTESSNGYSEASAQQGAGEWTVNLSDDNQPAMTTADVVAAVRNGTVPADTYVWKDGMADWQAISEVPELMREIGGGAPAFAAAPAYSPAPAYAPAPAPAYAPAPEPEHAFSGTVVMNEPMQSPYGSPAAAVASPLAAASASAGASPARRAARGSGVDLFGARDAAPEPAAAAAQFNTAGAGGHTGERNENSVLFSLSSLTATENAAKALKPRTDDVLDLRPAQRSNNNSGRAALDDILALGGGGIASGPALAPPPLLAPVIEPPPAPAPMPMAMMGAPAMSPMMAPSQGAPKSRAGLVVGLLVGLAAAAGAAFFLLRPAGPAVAPPASLEQVAAQAPAPAPEKVAAADAPAVAEKPTEAPTAVAPGATTPPPEKTAAAATPTAATPQKGAATPAPEKTAAAPAPEKTAEKPPEAPAPASGNEFSRGAATSALGAAAGSARSCKKPDGPTGSGKVKVTFAPSGNVTSAQVQGSPFAGTSVGGCVAGVFRGAHVPPFDGSPVTVTKSFSID